MVQYSSYQFFASPINFNFIITDLRTNNVIPFNIKIPEVSTDNHNGILLREVSNSPEQFGDLKRESVCR